MKTFIVSFIDPDGVLKTKKIQAADRNEAIMEASDYTQPCDVFEPKSISGFSFAVVCYVDGTLKSTQVWTRENSWVQALHQAGYNSPKFSGDLKLAPQFDIISLNDTNLENTMKQIQSMPDIWDDKSFWTSRSTVMGAFAQVVVRQSLYVYPLDLVSGLVEFNNAFSQDDCFKTNCRDLNNLVRAAIEKCPTVLGWDKPRKSGHVTVFCLNRLSPDHDFIALNAMARNIAHAVTLEEKYNDLHE